MLRLLPVLFFCFFATLNILAQAPCGHTVFLKNALRDTAFAQLHEALEQEVVHFFQNPKRHSGAENGGQAIIIPVVVHILHNAGAENIADTQVQQAIQFLNAAFANAGPYDQGSGVNTNIRFCLATRDPTGAATTGILRTQTPLTSLNLAKDRDAKALSYWPSGQYLNIWVVREICWESLGCEVAAYASSPSFHGNSNDGIVIEHTFFGIAPGRITVLAHETGHYLGLYHTFEGGCGNNDCLKDGDRVCDTPPDQSTASIPCDQMVNTCNTDAQSGLTTDLPDAVHNFLDYGNITCFHDFTTGQAERMAFFLNEKRKSLLTSEGCSLPCTEVVKVAFIPGDTIINLGTTLSFQSQSANATNFEWQLNGQIISTSNSASYTFSQQGVYTVLLTAQSANPALCPSSSISHNIQVICPVTADFRYSPSAPKVGELVIFTNLSQNFTTTEWFINGVSQGPTLNTFTPTGPATYLVRLVAGNGICQREKNLSFTISEDCKEVLFQKIISSGVDNTIAKATVELSDGSLLLGGDCKINPIAVGIVLIKTDANGKELWTKQFGGADDLILEDIIALNDGGGVLSGTLTDQSNIKNAFLARFSSIGDIIWAKKVPAARGGRFVKLLHTVDNLIVAAGWIKDSDNDKKSIYLTKMDVNGNALWSRQYNATQDIEITDIKEDASLNLVASGIMTEFDSIGTDAVAIKFNRLGGLPEARQYAIPENNIDERFYAIDCSGATVRLYGSVYNFSQSVPNFTLAKGYYAWEVETFDLSGNQGAFSNLKAYNLVQSLLGNHLAFEKSLTIGPESNPIARIITGEAAGTREGACLQLSSRADLLLYAQGTRFFDISATADNYLLVAGKTWEDGKDKMFWIKTDIRGFVGGCSSDGIPVPLSSTVSDLDVIEFPLENAFPLPLENYMIEVLTSFSVSSSACPENICAEDACKAGWVKKFGLSQPPLTIEGISCLVNALDGTIAAAGFRRDSIVLINTTSDGTILWLRTISIPTGRTCRPTDMLIDSDGNWVVAGYLGPNLNNSFVLKYNPLAETVLWYKVSDVANEILSILEKTPGGNYLLNMTYQRMASSGVLPTPAVLEVNRNTGAFMATGSWSPGEGIQGAFNKIKRHQNSVWAVGYLKDTAAVIRFGATGQPDSKQLIKLDHVAFEPAMDMEFDKDSIILLMKSFDGVQYNRIYLVKINPNGDRIWSKSYYFSPLITFGEVKLRQMEPLPDGGFVIMGDYRISAFQSALIVVRFDRQGSLIWSRQIVTDRLNFYGNRHLLIQDNSIFLGAENLGTTERNFWLARISLKTGNIGSTACSLFSSVGLQRDTSPNIWTEIIELPTAITFDPKWNDQPLASRNGLIGPEGYPCATPCQEICGNGISDDYDDAPDCFDSSCNCGYGCNGERSNTWYFGRNAGLDFTTDPPIILTDGKTNTRGPTTVQSGPDGKLLFYYDSTLVYDRRHKPMLNGNLATSTGYGAMSVPTGDNKKYILFTTNGSNVFGSEIQMNRQKYFGDLDPALKNIQKSVQPGNKFTILTCSTGLFKLIVKLKEGNIWQVFEGNGLGTGTPILSNAGTPNINGYNDTGQLKFSHDGQVLANTLPGTGGFDLLNFDFSTGKISEGITVIFPELKDAFGLEFSPDDRYLYVSTYGQPSYIWQFDLQAGDNAAAIINSRVLIAKNPVAKTFAYLQLARNGKIYVAMNPDNAGSNALSVIHRPNIKNLACQFQERGQPLGTGRCYFGLPQFVQQELGQPLTPRIIAPDSVCGVPAKINVRLRGVSCNNLFFVEAQGPLSSTFFPGRASFDIELPFAGDMLLKLTKEGGCDQQQTLLKRIKIRTGTAPLLSLGPDRTLCATGVTTLRATPGFARYQWGDGTSDSTLTTFSPGKYTLEAWDDCGRSQKDTVEIKVAQNTKPDLGPDQRVCRVAGTKIQRPNNFVQWQWSPKQYLSCDTCPIVRINPAQNTEYVVIAQTAAGCLGADTLRIAPDTILSRLDTFICLGRRLPFLGTSLPPDTTATFALLTAKGCDSLLRVSTIGLDTVVRRVSLRACPSDSVLVAGQFVRAGQTRNIVFTGRGGCDSTIVAQVIPFPTARVTLPRDTSLKIGDTLTLRTMASGGTGKLMFNWSPPEGLSCVNCTAPIFRALVIDTFTYTFTAKDINGCLGTGTVTLAVNDSCTVFWPNVFTPDGDGVNDLFYLMAFPCVDRITSFMVYSRWGDVVFSRTDFSPNDPAMGWDGTDTAGRPFPTDVLFWTATVQYYDGKKAGFKGEVTVLR